MYIDDNCNICASCAFFAGNVCAAYQCELKDLIGTWCKFFEDYKEDKNDEDDSI